jgi:hypothetical protein
MSAALADQDCRCELRAIRVQNIVARWETAAGRAFGCGPDQDLQYRIGARPPTRGHVGDGSVSGGPPAAGGIWDLSPAVGSDFGQQWSS